jgi:solute carrier family 6 GABA transporter-like protein 1
VAPSGSKNWSIPIFWGHLLRYISVPILAIILSFSYPSFAAVRHDPCHIVGFAIANLTMVFVAVGWLLPKFYDPFVPIEKRGEGHIGLAPNETVAVVEAFWGRMGRRHGGGYDGRDEPVGFGGKAMA